MDDEETHFCFAKIWPKDEAQPHQVAADFLCGILLSVLAYQ